MLEAAGDDAQGPKYADSFKVLGQGNRNRATGSRGELPVAGQQEACACILLEAAGGDAQGPNSVDAQGTNEYALIVLRC